MASIYFPLLALLTAIAYFFARSRASAFAYGKSSNAAHSLPVYHGLFIASVIFLVMLLLYAVGAPLVENLAYSSAASHLPQETLANHLQTGAAFRDIYGIAGGREISSASEEIQAAANSYVSTKQFGQWALVAVGAVAAFSLMGFGVSRLSPRFRARNWFEQLVKVVLIICAAIAILTTIGIVMSVLTETYRFFFDPDIRLSSRSRSSRSLASCSARNGTRRPPCAPTRATFKAALASFPCSPVRC